MYSIDSNTQIVFRGAANLVCTCGPVCLQFCRQAQDLQKWLARFRPERANQSTNGENKSNQYLHISPLKAHVPACRSFGHRAHAAACNAAVPEAWQNHVAYDRVQGRFELRFTHTKLPGIGAGTFLKSVWTWFEG